MLGTCLLLDFFSQKESILAEGLCKGFCLPLVYFKFANWSSEGRFSPFNAVSPLTDSLYKRGWRCVGVGAMQPFMPVFSAMTHEAGKFENLPHTARNRAPFPATGVGVVTEACCSVCFAWKEPGWPKFSRCGYDSRSRNKGTARWRVQIVLQ